MTDSISLALSTHIAPAKKFTVDGEVYELLGTDHLSPADEAEVMALFARHTLQAVELDNTANVVKGTALAESVRKTRMRILGKLTTLPVEVASKLPMAAQVQLLEAVQEEISGDDLTEPEDAPREDS